MNRAPLFLLYLNVLVIGTCGLIYELLAGTLASYVLGDSVTQFSLTIGIYLSALGVGAWLSRYIEKGVARCFIEVELAVALIGGLSAPVLFLTFAYVDWFRVVLFGLVFLIGLLVGLELPLLMRILKDHLDFNDLVSRVLSFDYIGALLASVLFPILFVPRLGLIRTSVLFGMLNAAVGLWGSHLLRPLLKKRGLGRLRGRACLVLGVLAIALIKAESLTTLMEENTLAHPVVHARSTPYQRIVITRNNSDFQLYLNGQLQFNSVDEYRYHEALVHPALSQVPVPRHVLVLGGGDGLALREVLRHSSVETVTLVDIDPEMTALARSFEPLAELNDRALQNERVRVVNEDAFVWVDRSPAVLFDAVVIDFPDPGTFSVGKLYTRRFFRMLSQHLDPQAVIGIQCTSPLVAPRSYWCVIRTMEAAGFSVRPYRASVPSFGVWGFGLASLAPLKDNLSLRNEIAGNLRFLNADVMRSMFDLPTDLLPVETQVNRLNSQVLVRYYEQEWDGWN